MCVHGPNLPPQAVDPATGELVWSAGWLPPLGGDGWFSTFEPDHPRLAGYLVLNGTSGEGHDQHRWLIDARTGAPVLDLKHWQVASTGDPTATGPADPVMVWQDGDGPTWFGRLRSDLSGVDVLGMIDRPAAYRCQPLDRYVVCWSWPPEFPDEQDPESQPRVEVWRARW